MRAAPARLLQHAQPYDFCLPGARFQREPWPSSCEGFDGLRYLVRVSGPDIPGFEQRYGPIYPILSSRHSRRVANAEVTVAKCEVRPR
jgi:hypothetical protein